MNCCQFSPSSLCTLGWLGSLLLLAALAQPATPAAAPAQLEHELRIDDPVLAFAFAPDNRIAYAVRRIVKERRLEMQRDDIWVTSLDGKRKRIVDGAKLVSGSAPFSYSVRALRWAPDGRRLTVELDTNQMVDERGTTEAGQLVLLLDERGKEIKIQGADSVIPEAENAAWLDDGVTVAYLAEAVEPRVLFGVFTVRPVAGRGRRMFDQHAYAAVAWYARGGFGIAVERDASLEGRLRLVRLDVAKQTREVLTEFDVFLGQLTISPSGKQVAYFRDGETLVIRSLTDAAAARQVKMTYGTYQWVPDEQRVLLRRGTDERSGILQWVRLADGAVTPLLHSLTFQDFALSPDGKWLAVTQPGTRYLLVYPAE